MQAKVNDSIRLVNLLNLTDFLPSFLERCHNPAAGQVLLLLMPSCGPAVADAGTLASRRIHS